MKVRLPRAQFTFKVILIIVGHCSAFLTDNCNELCWQNEDASHEANLQCQIENMGNIDPEGWEIDGDGVRTVSSDVELPPLPTLTLHETFVEDTPDRRCETKVKLSIHVSDHESRSAVKAYMVWLNGLSGSTVNTQRFILINVTTMTEADWRSLGTDLILEIDCFATYAHGMKIDFAVAQFPHYVGAPRADFEVSREFEAKALDYDARNPNICVEAPPPTDPPPPTTTTTTPTTTPATTTPAGTPVTARNVDGESEAATMQSWAIALIIVGVIVVLLLGVCATGLVVYCKRKRDSRCGKDIDDPFFDVTTLGHPPSLYPGKVCTLHTNPTASVACPGCYRSDINPGVPSQTYTGLSGDQLKYMDLNSNNQKPPPPSITTAKLENGGLDWFVQDPDEKNDSGFSMTSASPTIASDNLDTQSSVQC